MGRWAMATSAADLDMRARPGVAADPHWIQHETLSRRLAEQETAPRATVLVVEDEAITRELIALYLTRAGFDVEAASGGEEALRIMRKRGDGIDWLLTDVNLPDTVSGWVVGAEFRLTHPLRPVVYVTASERPSERQVSGSLVFQKPFDPAQIVAAFRRLQGAVQEYGTPLALKGRAVPAYAPTARVAA